MGSPGRNQPDRITLPGEVTSAWTFRGCFFGMLITLSIWMLVAIGYLLSNWILGDAYRVNVNLPGLRMNNGPDPLVKGLDTQ